MKKVTCTIASLNYFAQVQCLASSIRANSPDTDFYVLLADKVSDRSIREKIEAIDTITKIFYVEDLELDQLTELAFKYNLIEFNTALKPYFLEFLLQKYDCDGVAYLDPDTMLFHSLNGLFDLQNDHSIILTPHLLDPDRNDRQILDFLQYGVYNLGFISVRRDQNGEKLLNWWKNKLTDYCYFDLHGGIVYDQKWLDFAPAFFDSVYILKDPGYNFAFWNMNERIVTTRHNQFMVNGAYPLVFAHFSHYRPQYRHEIAHVENFKLRYVVRETPALIQIFEQYDQMLLQNDYAFYSTLSYGFATFDNGEEIQQAHRKLYSELLRANREIGNPFDTSCENSFYSLSLKAFLSLSSVSQGRSIGALDA